MKVTNDCKLCGRRFETPMEKFKGRNRYPDVYFTVRCPSDDDFYLNAVCTECETSLLNALKAEASRIKEAFA